MDPTRSIDRVCGPNGDRVGRISALALGAALAMQPTITAASASVSAVGQAHAAREAPELPLPRMPGMTKLSSSAEFDAETDTWKLKAAYRVNAHVPHVLAFYRKALENEALAVEDIPPAGEDDPYVLLGRNDTVRAQVGIRTKPHELETRVWLFWRVRA